MITPIQTDWLPCAASKVPALEENQIHCWHIANYVEHTDSFLTTDDLKTADKYSGGRVTEFLAARSVLRALLRNYSVTDPTAPISVSDQGKPRIADDSIHFSQSHTDNSLLIAIALSAVGVDLESPQRVLSEQQQTKIAARFFPELTPSDSPQAFTEAWTAYEASQKLGGDGIFGEKCTPKQLYSLATPDGLIAAIASNTPKPSDLKFLQLRL